MNTSGLADDILRDMAAPFEFNGKSVTTSASIGIAIVEAKMAHPEQLVADADTALCHAKERGCGRWSFFATEMHEKAIATKRLTA